MSSFLLRVAFYKAGIIPFYAGWASRTLRCCCEDKRLQADRPVIPTMSAVSHHSAVTSNTPLAAISTRSERSQTIDCYCRTNSIVSSITSSPSWSMVSVSASPDTCTNKLGAPNPTKLVKPALALLSKVCVTVSRPVLLSRE